MNFYYFRLMMRMVASLSKALMLSINTVAHIKSFNYTKRNFVAIRSFMTADLQEQAKEIIRRTGDRVTPSRVQTLFILLSEQRAITHHEIETRLQGNLQLDRVTLYRVLEWLSEKGLVHKIASDDRVWRFRANVDMHAHQHAHFKCTRCTKVTCLDGIDTAYNWPLPAGYHFQMAELTVKGLCAECA